MSHTKLFNQGMITGKNGIKMSKSKGNVVSPDDLVRDYGCDSLRFTHLDTILTGNHTLIKQFGKWLIKVNYSDII